jgi:S1-C subfamily serine protease
MSILKWIIGGVVLLAIAAVTLYLVFPPTIRVTTIGGPVIVVEGDIPTRGLLGIEADPNPAGRGLVVRSVVPSSGADVSGLRIGDVLLAADAVSVAKVQDLQQVIAAKKPGEVVRLRVERKAEALSLDVTLVSFEEMVRLREKEGPTPEAP